MRTIVIPEDDLKRIERRYGPDVRLLGPWSSDGVFGYASVSLGAVESAAAGLGQAGLLEAVSRLKEAREPVAAFFDLVEAGGPDLIARIKAAYSATMLAPLCGRPVSSSRVATSRASFATTAA
jgi:hypothetical protein